MRATSKAAPEPKPSAAEYAIALAAWVSVHWLRPVSFEEDEVARAIAWNNLADQWDDVFDGLMPSNPREHMDCCPEIVEAADNILPGGTAKSLWRYHFFEATTDPTTTDAAHVLRVLEKALNERTLPGAEDRAVAIGPYRAGPLGILELPRGITSTAQSEWGEETPTVLPGSLASYVQTIGDYKGNDAYVETVPDAPLDGWSPPWREWFQTRGPIDKEADDIAVPDGVAQPVRVSFRQDWVPPGEFTQKQVFHGAELLADWPGSALRDVLQLSPTDLRKTLARCLEHDRKSFFDGLNGTNARAAAKTLAGALDEVPFGALRQFVLLASPEIVVSAAMELGCGKYAAAWGTYSFAEYLTSALLQAYSLADCNDTLVRFMAKAGGSDWDRVLHYVVKQEPRKVLQVQLSANPLVACAMAKVTCAPLRFHSAEGWDPSDMAEVTGLAEHVGMVLGEERPPPPPERALPFRPLPAEMLSPEDAKDQINRGRRRPEYLLKTAIQYVYALLSHSHAPSEPEWRQGRHEVASPPFFWRDPEFVDQIARHSKNRNSNPIVVRDDAALVFSDLMTVLTVVGKMIPADAPAFLLAVRDAQSDFLRLIQKWEVSASGNLGSHDNRIARKKIGDALHSLAQFDSEVRAIDDALPSFSVFVEAIRKPNRPTLVRVEPFEQLGMMHSKAKTEHHITNPDLSFRGDRVYSFTDVTRNQVSVNPVILDWNDWLAWSATPEANASPGDR